MNNFWKEKKVVVVGGAGFIGSFVVEKLVAQGAHVTVLDNLQNGSKENLKDVWSNIQFIKEDCTDIEKTKRVYRGKDIVMNLAARVGGIEYNRTHQATMMRDNLLLETAVLEAARLARVKRFLVVSSACVYPRNCSIPTLEEEGFLDEPEPTNGGYGWAKRMGEKLGTYYHEEFGMEVGIVRPYNCYGPRDHFDPKISHVIPALIKRVIEGEDPVKVWGSGNQTRAFLYVEDLAEGMILAAEKYPNADQINLGADEEISMKDLIKKICKITDRNPRVEFDISKPDGSPRRNSDNSKAKKKIQFYARTSLDSGLTKTIRWYINTIKK